MTVGGKMSSNMRKNLGLAVNLFMGFAVMGALITLCHLQEESFFTASLRPAGLNAPVAQR
jgi:hypothetical protein